jgi:hypothetical protein
MGGKPMKTRHPTFRLVPGILGLALICSPVFAQSTSRQGETSGPAAGKTTVPNSATEKNTSNRNTATASGGAGIEGKAGSKSGPAPQGRQTSSSNR